MKDESKVNMDANDTLIELAHWLGPEKFLTILASVLKGAAYDTDGPVSDQWRQAAERLGF